MKAKPKVRPKRSTPPSPPGGELDRERLLLLSLALVNVMSSVTVVKAQVDACLAACPGNAELENLEALFLKIGAVLQEVIGDAAEAEADPDPTPAKGRTHAQPKRATRPRRG